MAPWTGVFRMVAHAVIATATSAEAASVSPVHSY